MPKTVIASCEEKMLKTIESLKKDFSKIRTGKANPAILNDVMVNYYGVPTPVSQVGSVSASDPQTIVVKPWDKSILKDIEKAILTAGLGLNPQNDGELLYAYYNFIIILNCPLIDFSIFFGYNLL